MAIYLLYIICQLTIYLKQSSIEFNQALNHYETCRLLIADNYYCCWFVEECKTSLFDHIKSILKNIQKF